jgi:hypothetical protein
VLSLRFEDLEAVAQDAERARQLSRAAASGLARDEVTAGDIAVWPVGGTQSVQSGMVGHFDGPALWRSAEAGRALLGRSSPEAIRSSDPLGPCYVARFQLESLELGDAYSALVAMVRSESGPRVSEAWRTPRIAADAEMPLGVANLVAKHGQLMPKDEDPRRHSGTPIASPPIRAGGAGTRRRLIRVDGHFWNASMLRPHTESARRLRRA